MTHVRTVRNHTLRLAIAIALVTPAAPHVASAAAALEEITVTAQRREESLQDTPVFVTPLQAEELQKRNINNTEDLLGNIAGIGGFTSPGARAATSLNIRGVSGSNGANLSADPAVGMYIDGVYLGKMMASGMDFAEIERMEIMRGPQASLYGRNATAGAISITTAKPSGEAGLRATASYGNYNDTVIKLFGDLPAFGEVGEGLGRLALGAGYQMRQRDGWVKNTGKGQDFDNIDRYAWRVAANWQPIDAVTVDYSYDKSSLNEVGPLQKVIGFTPVYDNPAYPAYRMDRIPYLQDILTRAQAWATNPYADPRIASRWIPSLRDTIAAYEAALASGQGRPSKGAVDVMPINDDWADGHTLNVAWQAGELGPFGDVTFKSITGYRRFKTYVDGDLENIDSTMTNGIGAYNDLVHLTLDQIYGGTVAAGYPPVASGTVDNLWNYIDQLGTNTSQQDTLSRYKQFSEEVQMIGSTAQLDYLLGVMYFSDDGEYRRNSLYAAPLTGRPPQYYDNNTDSIAYYAHGAYKVPGLDDRLVLSGGVRYTEEKKGIHYMYGAYSTPFGSVPDQDLKLDDNFYNLSYDATATYHFTDSFNAFLRYANGYRSGGFNGENFDNPYGEETIEQWELGMKSEWLDQRLRLNASVYRWVGSDLQVGVIKLIDNAPTSLLVNAGKATRWGSDIEIAAVPIDDVVLTFAYSYVHGDYDEFPPTCAVSGICLDTSNLAKRTSPGNSLSATADWTFARTESGDLDLYLQYTWQDETRRTSITTGLMGEAPYDFPYVYESPALDSRSLLGARLSWSNIPVGNKSLKLTLWGRNLLDDDYPTFGINFASLGLITNQYGEPRTYGIEASYKF